MDASHYRKVELQSPADFAYLYANTVALSRRKLDLHLPPSATTDNTPDPMRERVRELVDEFIDRTFTAASHSISINGLDSSSPHFPFPSPFNAPETVEYEPYDTELASRVTSLYAQLESLTTTVAQLRRDAPGRAAKEYAEKLSRALEDDDEYEEEKEDEEEFGADDEDDDNQTQSQRQPQQQKRRRGNRQAGHSINPEWKIQIPFDSEAEAERWESGDVADLYEDALRMLLRLQGESVPGDPSEVENPNETADSRALATTIGKAERAGRAAEIVGDI